jgi:hypothetical protein
VNAMVIAYEGRTYSFGDFLVLVEEKRDAERRAAAAIHAIAEQLYLEEKTQ